MAQIHKMYFPTYFHISICLAFISIFWQPGNTTRPVTPHDVTFSRLKRQLPEPSAVNNDIQFKTADLLTTLKVQDTYVQLQAYKIRNRLDEWVSIGQPVFIRNLNSSLYEFTPESIISRIRLLSNEQRAALEKVAKKRYPNISDPFIHLIPLQSIACATKFVQDGEHFSLEGHVRDLDQLEVTLEVSCSEETKLRNAFVARISQVNNLRWLCSFVAAGQEIQLNQIRISAEHMQEAAIEGNLFGPGDETYVTRNQLNALSQKIRTKFNIEEDMEVDEKYDQKIAQKLLDFAEKGFEQITIDDALQKLSQFSIDSVDQDLSPTKITKELSEKFKVENIGGKSFITSNNDMKGSSSNNSSNSKKFGLNVSLSFLNLSTSFDAVDKNRAQWSTGDYSLNEQLDELNWASRADMKWAVEGSKLIPKTLNVASIRRANINKDIKITYRKRIIKQAQYKKEIAISTDSFIPARDIVEEIWKNLNQTRVSFGENVDELRANMEQAKTLQGQRIDTLFQKTNAIMERKKKVIQSYNIVCQNASTYNTGFGSSLKDVLGPLHSKALYIDGFRCAPFGGGDFFVQNVDMSCETSRDPVRVSHCIRCCRYEFRYTDAYVTDGN